MPWMQATYSVGEDLAAFCPPKAFTMVINTEGIMGLLSMIFYRVLEIAVALNQLVLNFLKVHKKIN